MPQFKGIILNLSYIIRVKISLLIDLINISKNFKNISLL